MKNTFLHAVFTMLSTLLVAGGWPATPVEATETNATSVSSTGKCDYISLVDPRIETARGRWFFSTPAARPFGMAKLSPHTVNRGQGGGGYNCTVHTALGFCHLHGWMTTGLEVMPTTGGTFSVTRGEAGWKSAFDPKTEIVKPGYHKLFLEKYAMWVELTTTRRVGMHRYTYTKDGQANIVINLGGPAGPMKMKNGRITKVSDTQFEGYYDRTNGTWGGPAAVRIYFVIQFEKPFSNFTTYDDPKHKSTSAYVTYGNVSAGDIVQMKAALSFTSIANARANMAVELDHWNFDAVRDESFRIWNTWLGRIDVEGGTDAQRTKFYTDLWHVLLGRHVLNDVGGAYPDYTNGKGGNGSLKVKQLPLDADGKPKFNMYNSDAYWLTQWNINLVWGLAWPRMLDEFCNASLQMARDGGKLPRGPCGGGYTHIMTACPATMMIVGAYMKGCYTFDPEEAFAIIKDNHSVGGSNMLGADPFYVKNGWKPGSAGRTVEMCFQDWCAAQMARKLGKTNDYEEFMRRSAGWKKLFHPPTGLLLPRNADGRFSHTKPLSGRGWVEANAWQASWFTSHDVQGLANLMGGRDEYCRKLNFAFEKEADHDFVHGYGAGYVSYANQPGCQNAHLFNYAGKPWLTQYWVRRVNEQAYGGTTPQLGYGGHDEDQGQMGGVSSLMSMGLFSVRGTCAVAPIYEITTPVFDKITIALDDKYYSGRQFVISTRNNSAANTYIQSAKLDGRMLNNAWFYHSELADGGKLELVLGPEPNFNWGVAKLPPSESPPRLPAEEKGRRIHFARARSSRSLPCSTRRPSRGSDSRLPVEAGATEDFPRSKSSRTASHIGLYFFH
jgi:predicted alpha-1,2-mannosidase